MKRIFLFLMMLASVSLVKAQDINYLEYFPHKEGTTLVSKTYDGMNNLVSTMTMNIDKVYNYEDGSSYDIGYIVRDNMNNILNQGSIEARYANDNLTVGMSSRATYDKLSNYLSETTQLTGSFMDYPNLYTNVYEDKGEFDMSRDSNIQIMQQDGRTELGTVRVSNREILGTERVETPAGTFDATKIKYVVEINEDGMDKTYTGYEWFAPEGGIVRSEVYDLNSNQLKNYTVLTSITSM